MVLPLMLSGGGRGARCYVASARVARSLTERQIVAPRWGFCSCRGLSARELIMLWIPLAFCAGHIYYVTRIANFRRRERGSDGD